MEFKKWSNIRRIKPSIFEPTYLIREIDTCDSCYLVNVIDNLDTTSVMLWDLEKQFKIDKTPLFFINVRYKLFKLKNKLLGIIKGNGK